MPDTGPTFPAFALSTFTGTLSAPVPTLRNLRDIPVGRVAGYYAVLLLISLLLMAGILFGFLSSVPSAQPEHRLVAADLQVTLKSAGMMAVSILVGTLIAILVLAAMAYLCGGQGMPCSSRLPSSSPVSSSSGSSRT